jgi:hypothetical protein
LTAAVPYDHVRDAVIEITLYRVEVANAAAQLHGNLFADHAHDFANRQLVSRLAGDGAVEIDQMQALRALLQPMLRHRGRIFENTVTASCRPVSDERSDRPYVDRGDDLHGFV